MIFVCPKPPIWCDTVTRCRNAWEASGHTGEEPPWPLVLSGWIYSSDLDKQQRWRALVRWAEQKDLARLLPQLSEDDGYYVHDLSTSYPEQHYGPQTHPPAVCPSEQELAEALQRLRDAWPDVAGPGLADACHPSEFAGAKRNGQHHSIALAGERDPQPGGDAPYRQPAPPGLGGTLP